MASFSKKSNNIHQDPYADIFRGKVIDPFIKPPLETTKVPPRRGGLDVKALNRSIKAGKELKEQEKLESLKKAKFVPPLIKRDQPQMKMWDGGELPDLIKNPNMTFLIPKEWSLLSTKSAENRRKVLAAINKLRSISDALYRKDRYLYGNLIKSHKENIAKLMKMLKLAG